MTIVAILAVVAVPVAELQVQRKREAELRHTLREVRMAIDRMHDDWRAGVLSEDSSSVSENGFPENLQVLVEGIEDSDGGTRRYLRDLPVNVFARRASFDDQWLFLSYDDPPEARNWSGDDVYDLRPRTERTALDGTDIASW